MSDTELLPHFKMASAFLGLTKTLLLRYIANRMEHVGTHIL